MNLLIVDDEIFAIQGLLEDIQKEKVGLHEIYTANCYTQAVNIFLASSIDILLCDIEMPFGSGLDLVEWVKETYPQTECIFLTCHDEFDFARQAVKLKSFDYILKPATDEIVNEVLGKAVNHIKTNREEELYKEYGKVYFSTISKSEENEVANKKHVVEKAEEFIMMHLDEDLSVNQLAEQVYVSSTHLNRLFKKKYNKTVNDYITGKRMKVAKELLETTDLSVASISGKIGYSNYSYFIKMFKKNYGKTPREFRQEKGRL